MPNLAKILIALLATAVAFSVNAETRTVSQKEFNNTLDLAKAAYLENDFSSAAEHYEKAALMGDKHSQYVLGNLYTSGRGVERDAALGYAWIATTAENRDQAYRRSAKNTLKSLDGAEKARAESLAAELKAQYGMKATGVKCKKDASLGTNIKATVCKHRKLAANGDLIVPVYSDGAYASTIKSGAAGSDSR